MNEIDHKWTPAKFAKVFSILLQGMNLINACLNCNFVSLQKKGDHMNRCSKATVVVVQSFKVWTVCSQPYPTVVQTAE